MEHTKRRSHERDKAEMTQYKLVPVSLTMQMQTAMQNELPEHRDTLGAVMLVLAMHKAMIAAAPPVPDPYKALEIAREALKSCELTLAKVDAWFVSNAKNGVSSLNDADEELYDVRKALRKIDEVMK